MTRQITSSMRLIVVLAFALSAQCARADYMDYDFNVSCDTSQNSAEIVPYAVYNTNVYTAAAKDCVLSNGISIRARMGLGPEYPYGMGGGDPAKWISVWVNKAKVISRASFGCDEEGPCSLTIKISKKNLTTCRTLSRVGNASSDLDAPRRYKCSSMPLTKLTHIRDTLEYPEGAEKKRPPAGSMAMLFASDSKFCSNFSVENKLPNNAKRIDAASSLPYEYSGSYGWFDFDINNDGKMDKVLALNSTTHYRDGDIYFVYSSLEAVSDLEITTDKSSESQYARRALRILPHYWADYTDGYERKLANKDNDDGAYSVRSIDAPWWNKNDIPTFRFRYWHLQPFRYRNTTYFVASSMEADKMHWRVVLRPEADFKVTEMCVLQVVPENY